MSEHSEHQEDKLNSVEETRGHHEGLGDQWAVLVGNPAQLMPQIVGTVVHSGGTRPAWQWADREHEHVLMAWPEKEPIRAGVILSGPVDGQLKPITAMPLLEGLPNNLTVDTVHAWENRAAAHVALSIEGYSRPLWFYTPVYDRDKEALTPGVTHTFMVAGLAYGLRRALLDTLTIAQGPHYEAHAEAWLEANPDKKRLDVPPLQINVAGSRLIMPGNNYCEYQMRAPVVSVEKTHLDQQEVYMLHLRFEIADRDPLDIMVYAPKRVCAPDYEPKAGDEVDMYVWLQGRIMD